MFFSKVLGKGSRPPFQESRAPRSQGQRTVSLGNLPRVGGLCPLPAPGETEVDNSAGSAHGQIPDPASWPVRQLIGGTRLAACGLDLVPRCVLFGPQSPEKCVS